VCTPHTGSLNLPDGSEAVCIPHTVSFGLPDANEAVCTPVSFGRCKLCNPHAVSFGLPDANERCATHTPLRSGFFIPPVVWGGSFRVTARTRRRKVHTPPRSRSILPPGNSVLTTGRCDCYHTAPISFHLTPLITGGFSSLQHR
jgi:hypothetical protein